MKLSRKLSFAMGTLTLIIMFSNVFSTYQMSRVNQTSTVLADQWLPGIVAIEEMNTLFSDYRIAEIQHAIAEEDSVMTYYEKSMQEANTEFYNRAKIYELIPQTPEEKRLYSEYKTVVSEYDAIHEQIAKLSRVNNTQAAIALLNGTSRDAYIKASGLLLRIVKLNIEGSKAASEEGNAIYASVSFSLTVLLIVSILLATGISFSIVRGTLRQLGKDPGELQMIARRVTGGDYNVDDGGAKIGVYAEIVAMVNALKENIAKAQQESQRAAEESRKAQESQVQAEAASADAQRKTASMLHAADKLEEVANIVSSASQELSLQIEQSERGASEQASRVAETATAMEEMNSTVLEVAKNAGSASDVSAATRLKAESGSAVVEKAVKSIRDVQHQSLRLKEDMNKLDENAKSISQIMGVISDIADQTNLLALNAAIEAARAGDAGRGFAVVADEVRKLAEKTMASTTDVGNAIRNIQQSATQNMAQVDSAVKSIEEATEYANASGVALSEIVTMVDSTADQVRAIATASEQQSASSEEINQSINQVNHIAGETARAMEEASHAVSDLASQAQVLARLIEDMKRG